jgi:branched-chain amino acid transport system permease protein
VAGALSALTALLQQPILGFEIGITGGYTLLLRALAAAVIGRMESLSVTFAAAILITMAQQALFFGTSHSGPDDGLVLAVLVVALLVQRKRISRMEGGESSWQGISEVRPIPAELTHTFEIRLARWGGLAVGVVAAILPPFLLGPRNTSLLSAILIYAMVGVSLVILTGWAGNVSLGQWALVGVGGLVATKLASLANPPDFFLILLLAGAGGAFIATVIGLPALRIRGFFLGVTTLAFAVAAGNWFFTFKQLTPNTPSIPRPVMFGIWDVSSERSYYFVCLAGLALAVFMARNIRRSRLGRVLIGMRDNENQAQSLGVSLVRAKLSAFAASGFLAAVAGVVYAYQQQNLRAIRFPAGQSIDMFAMVVIGGMGSLAGALLGAGYIKATYFLPAQFQLLAFGTGILLLLWVFPGGLGQILYSLRDKWLRWIATRRGILVPSLVADRRDEGVSPSHTGLSPPDAATAPEPALTTTGGPL